MALQFLKDVKPPDAALVVPAGQPCRMALEVQLYEGAGEAGGYLLITVGVDTLSAPDTTPGQYEPKGTVIEHSSMEVGLVYDPPSGNS
jgi:hypothetical protein